MDFYELYGKYKNKSEQEILKVKLIAYFEIIKRLILKEYGQCIREDRKNYLMNKRAEDIIQIVEEGASHPAVCNGKNIIYNIKALDGLKATFDRLQSDSTKKTDELVKRSDIITTDKDYIDTLEYVYNNNKDYEYFCLSVLLHETIHMTFELKKVILDKYGDVLTIIDGHVLTEGFTELIARELVSKYPEELKYWAPAHSKECKFARQVKENLGIDCYRIVFSDDCDRVIDSLGEDFKKINNKNDKAYLNYRQKGAQAFNNGDMLGLFEEYRKMGINYLYEIDKVQSNRESSQTGFNRISINISRFEPKQIALDKL